MKQTLSLKIILALISAGGLLLLTAPTRADVPYHISGTLKVTKVTDGDSLRSGKLQIRLFGVDAPEAKQLCNDDRGAEWHCGTAARDALRVIINAANIIECNLIDVDRYGRLVMRCFANGNDIAATLTRSGYTLAYRKYSKAYIDDEAAARHAKAGIWNGAFTPPWDWRRKQ